MKKWTSIQYSRLLSFTVLVGLPVFVLGTAQTGAAENEAGSAVANVQKVFAARPAGETGAVEYVSINVDGGSLVQVLNAFALQTGRNIVVGPNVVVTNGVNLHLNNVRWDEALDVILKPYGFGYRKVGDTFVVSRMSEISTLSAIEPLETKVFNLKYLDASDVQEVIRGQLSARGTSGVAMSRGMKGWRAASTGGSGAGRAASTVGSLARVEDKSGREESGKSKTLIVTDVPSSLARVGEVLARLDVLPQQVLVEARFVEVNRQLLRDLGLDFIYLDRGYSIGQAFSGVTPAGIADVFNPTKGAFWGADLSPAAAFAAKAGGDFQAAIRALQTDRDTKLLSAPRILTLNNQEATIHVGTKFPIIQSDVSGGNGANSTSTSLDYYENIGIQLNVVPQICGKDQINMIVHPSVSSIVDFESGAVSTGLSSNSTALTRYPVIDVRETETQILLKTGETATIGGLLDDRKEITQSKVPFLGDIPLIGRLFRRDITDNRTIDLLIFLTATIVTPENQDTVIGENGKSGITPPVMITVPAAAIEVPPAAVVETSVAVKAPEEQDAVSADQIMKELQK